MGHLDHAGPGQPENRRSFLVWVINGLGAILAAVLGIPIVSYVISPANRKSAVGDFKVAEGVRLTELNENQPVQGVIRDVRRDAWTLHPSDVLGRVWVIVRDKDRLATLAGRDDSVLLVFTTICPHLGCSVNRDAEGTGFACPCHAAEFTTTGDRVDRPGHPNPAARGMDTLDYALDPNDRNRLLVKYQNFKSTLDSKVPV